MDGVEVHDLRENEEAVLEPTSSSDLCWERDKAMDLLQDLNDDDRPFFVYIAWNGDAAEPIDEGERIGAMDEGVGEMVDYLKASGLWERTLMVFASDSGGADNYPLRGQQGTAWEGGLRSPAFVTGGALSEQRRGWLLK